MKSENQNSTNGQASKGSLGDKPAPDAVATPAEHNLTAKADAEVVAKAADPIGVKKA